MDAFPKFLSRQCAPFAKRLRDNPSTFYSAAFELQKLFVLGSHAEN